MRNRNVQLALSLFVSAGFLWWVLRGVDPARLMAALRAYNWLWAAPFLAATFASLYLRAVRWAWLLAPVKPLTSAELWPPICIGFGLNSLLPFRAGEFARAAVVAMKQKVGFAPVFGSLVVERLFDMITLLLMLTVVFANIAIAPDFSTTLWGYTVTGAMLTDGSKKVAVLFGAITVATLSLLVPATRNLVRRLVAGAPYAPPAFRAKVTEFFDGFVGGLAALKDWRATLAVTGLSVAIWVLVGWTFQLGAYGFAGMNMTLLQGVAITVITALAILVPAAPGYWGLLEVGILFGLQVLGVEKDFDRAVAYALVVHSMQYFPILAVGLYYLWKQEISLGDLDREKEQLAATAP